MAFGLSMSKRGNLIGSKCLNLDDSAAEAPLALVEDDRLAWGLSNSTFPSAKRVRGAYLTVIHKEVVNDLLHSVVQRGSRRQPRSKEEGG
jgi:hypothetical protein